MREILFRGKTEKSEWVEGLPFYGEDGTIDGIESKDGKLFTVIPETVGQYTGVKDKHEVKIFDGDIIYEKPPMNKYAYWGKVIWDEKRGAWRFLIFEHPDYVVNLATYGVEYTIIGNIHDNPELLKELQE